MIKKFLAIIIFFYILILFQTSFLVHFDIFSGKIISYGIILIPIVLITLASETSEAWKKSFSSSLSFFTLQNQFYGLVAAFSAGFFLDIFSENFIGFHILILTGLVVFIKFILQKHVRIPIIKPY